MCNISDLSHPPTYLLLALEQNIKTNSKKLLDHFRRLLDCTKHVQQTVKPLSYPRGRVLSHESFQWIAPTKSIKKEKNVSF